MAHATQALKPEIKEMLEEGLTRYRIAQRLRGKTCQSNVYKLAAQIQLERGAA